MCTVRSKINYFTYVSKTDCSKHAKQDDTCIANIMSSQKCPLWEVSQRSYSKDAYTSHKNLRCNLIKRTKTPYYFNFISINKTNSRINLKHINSLIGNVSAKNKLSYVNVNQLNFFGWIWLENDKSNSMYKLLP